MEFPETFSRAGANYVRDDFLGNYLSMLSLKNFIKKLRPPCKVIVSKIIYPSNNGKTSLSVKNVNNRLYILDIDLVDSRNVGRSCLNISGLYLNSIGYGMLAINFIKKTKILNKN